MRIYFIFAVTSIATFGLMVASIALALPIAFETQTVGWTAAPVGSLVVVAGTLLQIPLAFIHDIVGKKSDYGIVSVGLLSVTYGAAIAGLWKWWRWYRRIRI